MYHYNLLLEPVYSAYATVFWIYKSLIFVYLRIRSLLNRILSLYQCEVPIFVKMLVCMCVVWLPVCSPQPPAPGPACTLLACEVASLIYVQLCLPCTPTTVGWKLGWKQLCYAPCRRSIDICYLKLCFVHTLSSYGYVYNRNKIFYCYCFTVTLTICCHMFSMR